MPADLQPGSGAEVARVPIRVAGLADAPAVARLIAGFRDYYGGGEPPDDVISTTVGLLLGDERTEFLLAGEPAAGLAQLRFRPSECGSPRRWDGGRDLYLTRRL